MAKQTISIGTTANDGTGDPLRTAFTKVNENFTEVYDTAQSSFTQANTVFYITEISYNQANTANVKAQAAFDRANTTSNTTITLVGIKSLVANSATYAAFQAAIANL
jgi:hypothetical protein